MTQEFPRIVPVGLTGVLVTFSDQLSREANSAALAFRARLQAEKMVGVVETTTSLTSAFAVFDAAVVTRDTVTGQLRELLAEQDWMKSPLPANRKLWRVPSVFEGAFAPQLPEAAQLAQVDADTAVEQICSAPLRVLTLGFAPGQPYLGSLPHNWDIPRQTGITKQVPVGAITVAIRQIVLFSTPNPTGWRQVGQCAFQSFRPNQANPFALNPGDEMQFHPVSVSEFNDLRNDDSSGNGGATWETLS